MARSERAGWAALSVPLLLCACAGAHDGPFVDPALVVDSTLVETPATLPQTLDEEEGPPAPAVAASRRRAVQGFVRRGRAGTDLGGAGFGAAGDDTAGDISLDFDDADLATVIRVMLGEALGANYVIDQAVSGTVTLRTNRPLREDEVVRVLEEILRLNDAAIVRQGGVYSIVPRQEAGLTAPVVTMRDALSRGLTLRVTPLRFVGVDDVRAVLDDFAPVGGSITYDPRRDLVFSVGTAAEQRTLAEVIATLDTDTLAGRSFALVPLDAGEPQAVADELGQLFATPGGSPSTAVRFVAIERMNAVMIVSEEPSALDRALELTRFLDQSAGEAPRLHVFPVGARRADELASLLGRIFDAEVASASVGAPLADTVGGPLAPGARLRRDLGGGFGRDGLGDGPGDGLGDGRGTGLDRRALDGLGDEDGALLDALGGLDGRTGPEDTGRASSAGGSADPRGFAGSGVLRVVADNSSNAIVALATASGADALARALARLDVQPLQVLIEATLVEVALNDQLEFGVRWFLSEGNFDVSFGDLAGTGASTILPGFNAAFSTDDVQATLSALDSVTDVRLLSSPTLMVLDNQIARLQVGAEVPVTVRSSAPIENLDSAVEEFEFRETGVILEIRPTVNASGAVTLQIRQEVSDVVEGSAAVGDNPTFSQREVESTIAVQSGETIALAGLIEETQTILRDGIPVLSRIPVIGPVFGVTSDTAERTELLILIRPVVVRDQSDAREATAELREKLIGMVARPPGVGLRDVVPR